MTIWCKLCDNEAITVVLRVLDPLPLCGQCYRAFEIGQNSRNSSAMPVEDFVSEMSHMYSGNDLEAISKMIGLEEEDGTFYSNKSVLYPEGR